MITNKINPLLTFPFSYKFIFFSIFFTIIIFTVFINKSGEYNIFQNFSLSFNQVILIFIFYSISNLLRVFRLVIIANEYKINEIKTKQING